MLQEHIYHTPQELIKDCTAQLSREYELAEELQDANDEEICERLAALADDSDFGWTFQCFLDLERLQENLDFVVQAVFAA